LFSFGNPTPQAAAGGYTDNALPDNLYSAASQATMSYLYARFNADPRSSAFFTGNDMAMPRDLYH